MKKERTTWHKNPYSYKMKEHVNKKMMVIMCLKSCTCKIAAIPPTACFEEWMKGQKLAKDRLRERERERRETESVCVWERERRERMVEGREKREDGGREYRGGGRERRLEGKSDQGFGFRTRGKGLFFLIFSFGVEWIVERGRRGVVAMGVRSMTNMSMMGGEGMGILLQLFVFLYFVCVSVCVFFLIFLFSLFFPFVFFFSVVCAKTVKDIRK